LSGFALSGGITAGVLIGLAAIGVAYNKLTEDTRKLKEKTDDAIKSLDALRKAQEGPDAAVQEDIATATARRDALARDLARKQAAFARGTNENPYAKPFAEEEKEIRRLNALILAGQRDIEDRRQEAAIARNAEWYQAVEDQRALDAETRRLNKAAHAERMRQAEEYIAKLSRINVDVSAAAANVAGRASLPIGTAPIYQDPEAERYMRGKIEQEKFDREWRERQDREKREAEEKYSRDMRQIWRAGLGRILTDGTESFREFFEGVLSLFSQLMSRMEQEGKNKGGMFQMLGLGSAAIGGAFAGYQFGQQAGDRGAGAFGGAAIGAMNGAMIAGPLGAVVGGLTGLAGGLIGASEAANKAARALKEMQQQLDANIDAYTDKSFGGMSLDRQIEEAKREADRLREDAFKAFPGNGPWFNPNANPDPRLAERLAEIAASEARYIELLKQEQAIKNQQFGEDLEVRALRAQGLDKEADALALKNRHEREYAEAVKAGIDEVTLARLKEVQAMEAVKKIIDDLTTTVRNAPSGFYIERYIRGVLTGGSPTTTRPGWEQPLMPVGTLPGSRGSSQSAVFDFTGANITIDARDKTPKQAFAEWSKEFRKLRTSTIGLNAEPSLALTFLPE
jgi:hypothetical protein